MTSKLSIRQISVLTALDRDTVTRRLQGLPSEAGTKNARMYDSPAALRAVLAPALLAPGESTLEQIKVRTETLNAQLKEIDIQKKLKGLLPAEFCFGLIETFIKFCAKKFEDLRVHGKVDRAWIAECESHWGQLLAQSCKNFDATLPPRPPGTSHPPLPWEEASQTPQ